MTATPETLAQRLRLGPLSIREATQLCRALLSAIEAAPHGGISADTIVFQQGRPVLVRASAAASTAETDLYAIGCILYESVTGRVWAVGSDPSLADWTGVPRQLRRVLLRALSTTPERRWPDAAAFQRALWVPRPSHRIWPALVVILLAAVLISAFVFCKPLGLCWERAAP
jgi:hypothetical protein